MTEGLGLVAAAFDPARVADRLLGERNRRSRYLPSAFTTGAAWAILLDLYRSEPQRISSVCYGSGEAYTTALRHLVGLEAARLVLRSPCSDRRGSVLVLSPWARGQLTEYLAAIADRNPQGEDVQQASSRSDESGGSQSEIAQRKVA